MRAAPKPPSVSFSNSLNQPTSPDQVQPAPTSSSSPDTVPTARSALAGAGRDWLQVVGNLGLTGLAGGWTCSGMIGARRARGEWLGLANKDCVNWNMCLAREMSRAPTENTQRFDRRRVEAAKTFSEDVTGTKQSSSFDSPGFQPTPKSSRNVRPQFSALSRTQEIVQVIAY